MQWIVETSGAVTISAGDLLISSTADRIALFVYDILGMLHRQNMVITSCASRKVNIRCDFCSIGDSPAFITRGITLDSMSHKTSGIWRRVSQRHERSILKFIISNIY